MPHSMTAKTCAHVQNNQVSSTRIGTIIVQNDAGKMIPFKAGQHLTKRHYGHWYWKEAGLHVQPLGNDKYLLPTQPIV